MQLHFLSTFPEMLTTYLQQSILGRAASSQRVTYQVHNLRDWATDSHRSTDDHPYGGGPGMILQIELVAKALEALRFRKDTPQEKIILTSAKGKLFTQQTAQDWAKTLSRVLFICGHYEGVDERVAEHLVDAELRIGNYVVTGGELPSLLMADAVVRLLPGVLGSEQSLADESHTAPGYLEYPQYTRPASFQGWEVPSVLQQGNHAEIMKWRVAHAAKQSPTK